MKSSGLPLEQTCIQLNLCSWYDGEREKKKSFVCAQKLIIHRAIPSHELKKATERANQYDQ